MMKTLFCFLWLLIFQTIIAESFRRETSLNLNRTIRLLHALGPKSCPREVEKSTFDISSSLSKKGPEVHQALKMALKHTFEIFKKEGRGDWKPKVLGDLRGVLHSLLQQQTKSNENSKIQVSSKLEKLEKNFENLEQFLTQENFSKCAWEIVRNEILGVMDHFQKILRRLAV